MKNEEQIRAKIQEFEERAKKLKGEDLTVNEAFRTSLLWVLEEFII